MSRACSVIIVPEDADHAAVACGYLYERNVEPRTYHVCRKWTGKNGNFDRARAWFIEEVRVQVRRAVKAGLIVLIDEDGQGLEARRQQLTAELSQAGLPALDPAQGRLLVIPVRNVETWMVWAARWQAAGGPRSPAGPLGYPTVDETHDYKRWLTRGRGRIPPERRLAPFDLGRAIGRLKPRAAAARATARLGGDSETLE